MTAQPSLDEQALLASVFERLPIGVLVVDRDLRIQAFNATWRGYIERFAESHQFALGHSIAEDGPYMTNLCQRILNGEPEVYVEGAEIIANGQSTFWDITARPFGDAGAASRGVLVTVVEANQRVAANTLAQEREAQFRQIFETTPDAIVISEAETGTVVDANEAACAMYGYTRDEFIGIDVRQFIHPESMEALKACVEEAIAGGVFRLRALDLDKDGVVFTTDVSGSALQLGGKLYIVAIVRDITDQVRAEEALRDTHAQLEVSARKRTAELGMLVDVSREMGSTRDTETLMREVLERAGRLLGYSGGAVLLIEDESRLRVACVAGPDQPLHVGEVWPLDQAPVCAVAVHTSQPRIINDLVAHSAMAGDGIPRVFAATENARSWMGIPLLAQERVVGVMAFIHPEIDAFSGEHATLMLALGNQLAAAIENARLFGEADARTRELATLVEVSRDLSSTLEPRALLSRMLDRFKDVLACTGSSLLLMDDKDVHIIAARGLAIDQTPDSVEAMSGPRFTREAVQPIADAMEEHGFAIIEDVRGEGELAAAFRNAAGPMLRTIFEPIRAWMAVPLFRKGQMAGVLAASYITPAFFNQEHARLAAGFASQVSVALETSRLFEELDRRAKEMEALSRVASVVQLDEPVQHVLDRLAARVREATTALATTVTLVDAEGHLVNTGSAGHREEFVERMAIAARNGARLPSALAAREQRPVLMRNGREQILQNPRYTAAHALVQDAPWEGLVVLPMIYRGRSLGTINAFYAPGEFPGGDEISLVQSLADQAAIAMESLRLFEATERRLRGVQSLARVASSLTFDQSLDQTLNTLAEAVVDGSRAVASLLVLADDHDDVRVAGSRGLPEGYGDAVIQFYAAGSLPPEPLEALDRQELQVIRNVRAATLADPRQAVIHPFLREVEWDTVAIMPVTYHGRSIGTLNAYYVMSSVQDDAEVAFLATMADQAALALENARLFAETEQHIREIDALYRADEQLHQSLLLDDVLQALVDVVVDILHADKSLVVTFDREGGPLQVRACRGYTAEQLNIANAALATLRIDAVHNRAVPLVAEDAEHDPHTLRALTEPAGIRAYIDVPIIVGGEAFGIFSVNFMSVRRFSQDDIRLFTALGQRAAIAIENARLYARAQHAASLEERQRLARELHDSVSQALYGIALGARTARTLLDRDPKRVVDPLDYVLQLAEAGLAELRALIFELRPESLEMEGLIAAFNKQAAALSARHGIAVDTDFDAEPDVPLALKEGLYRIGQEAMHNTVKHAHASHVDLRLVEGDHTLTLEIRDDGEGFEPDGDFPGHLGITSMRERARAIGGAFTIDSAPGKGTCIRLELPR